MSRPENTWSDSIEWLISFVGVGTISILGWLVFLVYLFAKHVAETHH